jgi:hypothetical protein
VFVGAGLLNSPSKVRVQDSQVNTGILSWGDPTDSQRNIGKLCFIRELIDIAAVFAIRRPGDLGVKHHILV